MRCCKLSPSALFKLFVAAATLALGLAAASLRPRQSARAPTPPAAPARAEVSVRDTFAGAAGEERRSSPSGGTRAGRRRSSTPSP
ncbi:MAG TPA: hypothetical protein VF659_22320 [Pyrinomonadaceae bacterium]|jgi:hypothetical protein